MKRSTPERENDPGQNANTNDPGQNTGSCFPFAAMFCPPAASAGVHENNGLLSRDFDSMSWEEQNQVYRDLYGVDDVIDENEEFVQEKLQQMDDEIRKMPEEKKEAYLLAVMQSREYVTSHDFRLMFLRSLRFDAQKAAQRIVKHFEYKRKLFGDGPLARPVTQNDLSEDDMESLLAGGFRFVGKDRAGRPISWSRRMAFKWKTIDNFVRAVWYMFMVAVENDPEAQKNGLVVLVWNVGYFAPGMFNRQFYKKMSDVHNAALPVRIVGHHHCYNDFKERALTPVMMMFLTKESKTRYRSHVGSAAECLFELMTFGISPDILPVNQVGEIEIESHHRWVQEHGDAENSMKN